MIVAIIPARSGSKQLPGKNMINLCGQPLISYTFQAALDSKLIDFVLVTTDDEKIINFAKKFPEIHVIKRPKKISKDSSPTLEAIYHALTNFENKISKTFDLIVTLQPTSPLRKHHHIDEAILAIKSDPDSDSLVSYIPVPHQFEPGSLMKKNSNGYLVPTDPTFQSFPNRHLKAKYFARNGAAIYITKRNKINEYIWGGNCIGYQMKPEESIDIDGLDDLKVAENIMKNEK
jgi:CMP-N,N'-diacetyllegionaminic acid synthase